MGKTESTGFGGFDAMFQTLGHEVKNNEAANLNTENIKDEDDEKGAVDLSLGKKPEVDDVVNPDDLEKNSNTGEVEEEFNDEIPDKTEITKPKTKEQKEETEEVTEHEQTQIADFFDAFAELNGWDVNDDEKPSSLEELADYMQNLVEENSKPTYASDDVAALDTFVKNGGSIEDYLQSYNDVKDYSTIDLSDEDDQRKVVKDYLTHTGLSDAQIKRKLQKFEDAGLLEDEAEDALEFMKDIKEKEHEQLLQNQEKQAKEQEAAQQKFYTNVVSEIENLKDVRGIPVSKEDLTSLKNYLFKVDTDGMTRYQKDYSKSVRNLIESAYFTMKGDALISTARKSGETSAVRNLKQKLNSTKMNSSKHSMNDGESTPVWAIGSFLQKKNN